MLLLIKAQNPDRNSVAYDTWNMDEYAQIEHRSNGFAIVTGIGPQEWRYVEKERYPTIEAAFEQVKKDHEIDCSAP